MQLHPDTMEWFCAKVVSYVFDEIFLRVETNNSFKNLFI